MASRKPLQCSNLNRLLTEESGRITVDIAKRLLQPSAFLSFLPKPRNSKPLTKEQQKLLDARNKIEELTERIQGAKDVLSGKATADYGDAEEY